MRALRLFTIAALVVAPVVLVAPATATPLAADNSAHWSVAPADANGPDGRISLRHVIAPGEQVEDHIAVTNLGDRRAAFDVLAGDGVVGADGAFDVAAGDPETAGAWIEVAGQGDGEVTVAAGGTKVLPVKVSVPKNATPGDHPAGIVVARSSDDSGTSLTHRIGVRLHLQVDGPLEPRLEVSDVTTSFEPSAVPFAPGTLTATYRVTNTGNVRLGAGATVSSGLPLGLLERTGATTRDELLPGDSAEMSTAVRAWPTILTAGSVRVAPTVVGEDEIGPTSSVEDNFVRPAISWSTLAVLAGLVFLGWWVRRRRAGTKAAPASPTAGTPQRETVDA